MSATSVPRKSTRGALPQGRTPAPSPEDGALAARTEHLLAAAKKVFGQKSFAATTMDDIAGAAGMSKKTLYRLFESKNALFRAMLVRSVPTFHLHADAPFAGPPREQLRDMLRRLADIALSPDEIALHRLVVGEHGSSPDLAAIFADVIFDRGPKGVVDCIKRTPLKPELRDVPAKIVAEMILGVIFGSDHFKMMVDDGHRLDRRALARRIDLAVALFCAP